MASAERSLVSRVGWTAAACAVVASFVTLSVAVFVTDQQVIAEAETDALDLANALSRELDSEDIGPDGHDEIEEEVDEFARGSMLIAVDLDGEIVAGSTRIPTPPRNNPDPCGFSGAGDAQWLVCTVDGQSGYTVRIGEPRERLLAHRQPLWLGGMTALILVSMLSVLGGQLVARWSLRPLTELRGSLSKVSVSEEMTPPLPRSGMIEVDVLATTLDDLLGRLREEVTRSERFAGDAAHELRTPLAKLRTDMELLLETLADGGSDETMRLHRLVERTQSLSDLVDRLLLLASPRDALRSTTLVSLGASLEALAEERESTRIELSVRDDGMVLGDAVVLTAMVSNALDNALKFSTGIVSASIHREGDEVIVRVDDSGPGLSSERRAEVFGRFVRGAAQQGVPGHGIGLALIAHVVAAHDGTVGFVDGPPGAHLEIRLPRHRA